ncbi:signal recognition particle 9 kDa protein [Nilaparvata lugens]|uniref:signal recognition particle 9 kDa protein n=1 Tax=Nilaparvata lugens TaxID=108931 RepID=UPI00193D0817|nr:signal recognition particle 9 kDa protein [Nilaparvata lugens]
MFLKTWEEFEKSAMHLYLKDPMKIRYIMKYTHNKSILKIKITDDVVNLQFKTEIIQDFKKIERFVNNLMRHMASKERMVEDSRKS